MANYWAYLRAIGKLLRWIISDPQEDVVTRTGVATASHQSSKKTASEPSAASKPSAPDDNPTPAPRKRELQRNAVDERAQQQESDLPRDTITTEAPKPATTSPARELQQPRKPSYRAKHTVRRQGSIYLVLDDAEWYDTASPWRYCAARLTDLLEQVQHTPFEIESDGQHYLVGSPTALHEWVRDIFEREHSQGFAHMLESNIQKLPKPPDE